MKTHTYILTAGLLLAMGLMYFACKEEIKSDTADDEPISEEDIKRDTTTNPTFMTISDIHLDDAVPEVSYGCDTGTELWTAAQSKFISLVKKKNPGFILYLGDLPVHHGDSCLKKVVPSDSISDKIHGDIGQVLAGLRTIADSTNVPLLYLPGNNDGYGGDYASFSYIKANDTITPFTLDTLGTKDWPIIKGTKPDSYFQREGNATLGYYAAYPLGKDTTRTANLKVLMLNTVILSARYVSDDNINIYTAAQDQFDWMGKQLAKAKANKEKVILGMHIPPGLDGYSGTDMFWRNSPADTLKNGHTYVNEFVTLVDAHKDEITGILTSHTHMDELKRVFNKNNELIELCISTPGITVNHGNNPGMKVFEYDTNSYELLDYTTSYAQSDQGTFTFDNSQTYTFNSTYGGCSGAKTMLECISSISSDPTTAGRKAVVDLMEENYNVRHNVPATYNYPIGLDVLPNM
ncbi:metallophosphoesterase [Aureisphaera galaxeae]|uniref:metallophosphoesterase n=1 Tax=Aureisphaera galaxeae TaxID=1538023 RepID=UPI0023507FA2|nr:metallophosphoesterase [Aureisphaera galaxeae]MDC8003210.1 metallophosphoesterase [Aureisphaera galaxeae]